MLVSSDQYFKKVVVVLNVLILVMVDEIICPSLVNTKSMIH